MVTITITVSEQAEHPGRVDVKVKAIGLAIGAEVAVVNDFKVAFEQVTGKRARDKAAESTPNN